MIKKTVEEPVQAPKINNIEDNSNGDGKKKRRPKISISTQLFLSVLGIVLSFILTIILVDTRLMNGIYMFTTAWQLWDLSDNISDLYRQDAEPENIDNNDILIKGLEKAEKKYSISIEILNSEDQLLYTSDSKQKIYGLATDQKLKRQYDVNVSGDIGINKHFEIQRDRDASYRMEYIVFIAQLENGLTAKAYKMKTPMDEGLQIAIQIIVYTSLALIFIAVIMIRIFSIKFTKPLKDISAITHSIANLDFSKRCKESTSREISQLADNINEMSDSLSASLEDLKQKNKKLQDDYEKEKTLEQLRYEFITGVSHELKTPIAIIQGYAEGMQLFIDTDPESAKQYANIIISETGKMHDLVIKLLEIIKYDSGGYIINKEKFSINELIQDWFTREGNLLSEENITYENTIDISYYGEGDVLLLSSVVNNYLSNAVAHIDGERRLEAACEDLGGVYRISIFNTGKNIALKDIDKIWDSFYRADKSMSRAQGRFGLGLAIVASIQRLHKMGYGVQNENDGVRFWFDIEKAQ